MKTQEIFDQFDLGEVVSDNDRVIQAMDYHALKLRDDFEDELSEYLICYLGYKPKKAHTFIDEFQVYLKSKETSREERR